MLAKLENLNLPPSPPAGDAEFLRRAFIDTIGVLPTVDETRAFLADTSADKRDKLIDALLARPEFVDYWAYKWSDLLLVNSEKLRPAAMWSYYHWIRNHVAANTPWDQFARELVTATRQHAGKRRGQLLRAAPGSARAGRDRFGGLPGHVDQLREVPQPSAGKMDQRPVLRHGQPVRPRAFQGSRGRR